MLLLLLPSAVADVPVRGLHCRAHRSRSDGGVGGGMGWRAGVGGGAGGASILPGATGHHRRIPWTPKVLNFSGIWVTGGGVGMPRRCQKICLEQPPNRAHLLLPLPFRSLLLLPGPYYQTMLT